MFDFRKFQQHENIGFAGEPVKFWCRRCGMYLGTYDKNVVAKCSICEALTTQIPGKIHVFERMSKALSRAEIKQRIKDFQSLFIKQ